MKHRITAFAACALLAGCATQHLGREPSLTGFEREKMTCQDIDTEIARVDGFLTDADKEWSETHGRRTLAVFMDLGIGNHREWNDAIESADSRREQLLEARRAKSCPGQPEARPDI